MTLIDRHILARFLTNFAILLALLFVFATSIDLIHALGRFVEAVARAEGEDAGAAAKAIAFVRLVFDFEMPRFFQFYAYLHGLVAVGAMGFTLAQMYRQRELTAMLSAGLSMHRISMPFVVGAFALSVVQLLNQEIFLPRVAPLLLRDHGDIGKRSVDRFPIALTPDGRGHVFQAPRFDPRTKELTGLTILERDEKGRTRRRITADRATWSSRDAPDGAGVVEGWRLTNGRAVMLRAGDESGSGLGAGAGDAPRREVVDFFVTDLSPEALMVRRFGQFAALLNLRQIQRMLDMPGVSERDALLRYRYARFSLVLVNVLVMWMALPTFLLREPASLLRRTMLCATISIPALLGAAIFMVMDLPGISPAVGVFLPVLLFIPVVLGQWTFIKT